MSTLIADVYEIKIKVAQTGFVIFKNMGTRGKRVTIYLSKIFKQ